MVKRRNIWDMTYMWEWLLLHQCLAYMLFNTTEAHYSTVTQLSILCRQLSILVDSFRYSSTTSTTKTSLEYSSRITCYRRIVQFKTNQLSMYWPMRLRLNFSTHSTQTSNQTFGHTSHLNYGWNLAFLITSGYPGSNTGITPTPEGGWVCCPHHSASVCRQPACPRHRQQLSLPCSLQKKCGQRSLRARQVAQGEGSGVREDFSWPHGSWHADEKC